MLYWSCLVLLLGRQCTLVQPYGVEQKMKQLKVMAALLGIFGLVSVSQAAVVGTSSNEAYIKIKAVGADPHNPEKEGKGTPGINVVQGTASVHNKFVSLGKLEKTASRFPTLKIGGRDKANVVVFDFDGWNLLPPIPDHSTLGKFAYQDLDFGGPDKLYYGEWRAKKTGLNDPSHTVFYAGDNASYTNPGKTTVKYNVTGINQYSGGADKAGAPNDLLKGELTADFGKGSLAGTLTRTKAGDATKVVNTLALSGGTGIDAAKGSFNTNAVANGNVNGAANGHFFGKAAAAIGGIAKFEGQPNFDTAFGGSKK